ncbi:hypothetical protein [Cyanobium sp. ATX 6A2]|uniref:hypothetical protein n=1 Tax=Cyanobium sp. ATX 6A2 TaxID=2823700 RepID=UPI0020CEC5DB|nr:hypothetical protein [Cyanobium sp. ATX 6A2]
MEEAFDEITGSGNPYSLERLKTRFEITEKRFETSIKGRLEDSRDNPVDYRFSLDIVTRGKAIPAKGDPSIAKEFEIRKAEGFLRVRDEFGDAVGAIAFNLRTLFPIKLCKEVFKGDFEAIAAKIDPDRSSLSGSRGFRGLSLESLMGNNGANGGLMEVMPIALL